MKHLRDVDMNYFRHFIHAFKITLQLIGAILALAIHTVIPCLFERTASRILKRIINSVPPSGSRILVRFNTKWADDPQQRKWRVVVDGVEGLAYEVRIGTQVVTIEEPVDGIQKYHFLCYGTANGDGKGNVFIS